jgi:hypothetical protein
MKPKCLMVKDKTYGFTKDKGKLKLYLRLDEAFSIVVSLEKKHCQITTHIKKKVGPSIDR